jgi:hypothetical protein
MGVSAQAMYVAPSGNVGVGTLSPVTAVDVVRSAAPANFQLSSFTDTPNQAPQFIQRRAQGTSETPYAVGVGDNLGLVSFRGYTGSGFSGTKATLAAQATENWSPTANGTKLILGTVENGTTNLRNVLEITHDGQVKIMGSTLNVPDYVFEDDYQLMSLEELSAYVKENKHLPGVASADEVRTEGMNLAGSQLSVLEKVEELTLYTLQQNEVLKRLGIENTQLKTAYRELLSANQIQQEKLEKVDQLEQMVRLLVQRSEGDNVLAEAN